MPAKHQLVGHPVPVKNEVTGKYEHAPTPKPLVLKDERTWLCRFNPDLEPVELRRMAQAAFTPEKKLHAFAYTFYQGSGKSWAPQAGDFYTITRAEPVIYQITRIEDGQVYVVKCDQPEEELSCPFPLEGFTTEGFGVHRIPVPVHIFTMDGWW